MNPNVNYAIKALGLLIAYGAWGLMVWANKTPADGFVTGIVSLISFLTGNAIGQKAQKPEQKAVKDPLMIAITDPTTGVSPK